MQTSLVLALTFVLTNGFPSGQEVSFSERGIIEDVLKEAANDEVKDLFILIQNDLTKDLDDEVKKEIEELGIEIVSLFSSRTEQWFLDKVYPLMKNITIHTGDKIKDSFIALKNKVRDFVTDDDDEDSTDAPMSMMDDQNIMEGNMETEPDIPDDMGKMEIIMDNMDVRVRRKRDDDDYDDDDDEQPHHGQWPQYHIKGES